VRVSPVALLTLVATAITAPARAAPITDKTPGLDAPAPPRPGTVDFQFAHDFSVVGPKVVNAPSFLWEAGLFSWGSVAVRYGSRSTIDGRPNEVELLGKLALLSQARAQPIDVTVIGGYDTAANSALAELLVGRTLGRLGLLGALRGFSAGYAYGGVTSAAAVGVRFELTPYLFVVGDLSHVLGAHHWDRIRAASDRFGWSAGLAFAIPYTPHSFSVYASNLNAHSMLEASRGLEGWLVGFEFDVPFEGGKRWAAIFSSPKRTHLTVPASAPSSPSGPSSPSSPSTSSSAHEATP
jgi:hypothetical protein